MPATFAELFTPKLVTVLREGYRLRHFQADMMAGLTVAIDGVVRKAAKQGVPVYISGTNKTERREMVTHGISPRDVSFKSSAETALAHWRGAVR